MNAPVHPLDWIAPPPLWAGARDGVDPSADIARPALLRFASDVFMEELLAVLQRDPARVADYVARAETWRGVVEQPGRDELLAPPLPLANRARTLKTRAMARLGIGGGLLAQTPAQPPMLQARPQLKLYQPAHQRYYLVSAALVCQRPGFPDHAPDGGKQEQAGFVLRRLLPSAPQSDSQAPLPPLDLAQWDEYAWVNTAQGPGWQKLGAHRDETAVLTQAPGEELLPLFPLGFNEPNGFRRTMLAGLIPVGRREQYLGGRTITAGSDGRPKPPGASPKTARMAALRVQVTEPWKRLIETAERTRRLLDDPNNTDPANQAAIDAEKARILAAARDQIQHGSWLILLELADFLKIHLNPLWQQIAGNAPLDSSDPLNAALQQTVFSVADTVLLAQGTAYTDSAVKTSLRAALQAIAAGEPADPAQPLDPAADTPRNRLESATATFSRVAGGSGWPDFLFPLTDPDTALRWSPVAGNVGGLQPGDAVDVPGEGGVKEGTGSETGIAAALQDIDKLLALLVRVLPTSASAPAPAVPAAAERRSDFRDGWFVIRCVLSRPNCAPIHPHIVSAPTEPFQLAGFYDPDAPARPIRIPMPFDTTPAGLRKFNKNTAFEISNILCGQVQRAKGLGFGDLVMSVLPWPFHKDLGGSDGGPCKTDAGLSIGMICSLSIPIITICAFILLIIMVTLLDLIFRWLPWFIICFPVPGLKGKR